MLESEGPSARAVFPFISPRIALAAHSGGED